MLRFSLLVVISALCIAFFAASTLRAEEAAPTETPIQPVWKLMGEAEKRQFLAGYLYGFRDAKVLGEIGIQYTKENPSSAVQGLSQLLEHYTLTHRSPVELVPLLNNHLAKPENQKDSLRVAINKLQP